MDIQIVSSAVGSAGVLLTLYYMRRQTLAMEATIPSTLSEPTKTGRHLWPVLVGAVFVLIAWVPYWLTSSPKMPATVVVLETGPTNGEPPVPDKPFSANVVAIHKGPLTLVQDVIYDAEVFVSAPLLESAELETFKEFKKKSHPQDPRDMHFQEVQYNTFRTRILSNDDIKGWKNGTLKIYVMAYLQYRDVNGKWNEDFCETFLPPQPGDKRLALQGCLAIKEKIRPGD